MDYAAVIAVLQKLPDTYRRTGPIFDAWEVSEATAITRMTGGEDDILVQTNFGQATGNWLNVWGRMLGVIRNANEDDNDYRNRISGTMLAWRGTVPGIQAYMLLSMGLTVAVQENFPAVGWKLVIESGQSLTPSQKAALPGNLAFVRPAGVPFTVNEVTGGLFLTTGNFFGNTHFPGSWLMDPSAVDLTIPSTTNNSVPTLPTTWLTDPTINPSLG